MIRKSIITGTWLGLLLSLVSVFPALDLFVGKALPAFGARIDMIFGEAGLPGGARLAVTQPVLMVLAAVSTLILLGTGTVAALRAKVTGRRLGLLCGAISGIFAGLVFYILIISPTSTVMAGSSLLAYDPRPGFTTYPDDLVVPFARFILFGQMRSLLVAMLGGGLLGGLEGLLVGHLRRKHHGPPAPESLMDVVEARGGQRLWFRNYEEPVLSGLLTGVIGGAILVMTDFWSNAASLDQTDETGRWIAGIFAQAAEGVPLQHIQLALLPVLGLLSVLVVVSMGGVAALLPKNPPGFMRARVFAAAVSGTMVGVMISLLISSYLRFGLVILPQILSQAALEVDPAGEAFVKTLAVSETRVLLMYLLPLPLIFLITLGYTLWGTVQGIFYTLVFALLKLRPVDRARAQRRQIREHPEQFLPRLYALFQSDSSGVQVLEHLAFDLRSEPDQARVAAAYHTLTANPELAPRAFAQIAAALEAHPEWKLRGEILALHRALDQGLAARTVVQIAMLSPLPEDQTSSLPPALARAGDSLSKPLLELKKVERVDDLNARVIFLSNALESLRQARIFCKTGAVEGYATPLPEIDVLRLLVSQWEGIILSTIRDIQGRAELTAELKTRQVTRAPEMALTLLLANHGLNVAEKVRVQVECGAEGCEISEGGLQTFDILSPQETREIHLTLRAGPGAGSDGGDGSQPEAQPEAKPLGPTRLCWTVSYGDALKPDYVLEFADQVEFIQQEKPFQRIFPIPYVTGTPLQSEQMFVGRQDVFAFIREHLLGKYQNNIIVLHGQRRTGKSSILYRLGSELAGTHVCVLVDMQGKAARGEVDFLYSIADDIVYTLENRGIKVDLPERKAFEESPEFFFRSRFLRGVYDALGEKNLLLMFDEFEELQKRVEDGKLSADIFPYLRNLMQHERRLDFIFAGTHKLEELAAEYWSILFNIAIYHKITFLEMPEITRLVTAPVLPYGMEYDPLAVQRIYQVASGHPYFTQVVCHELVAYHNETRRSYITVSDVEAALERILERGEAHFKYIWAESTVPQRLVLMALAERLETEDAATVEDVAAILERRGRPLPNETILEALGNTEARDITGRSGPRSSLYRFRVDLIRRWLYAARPSYEKVV